MPFEAAAQVIAELASNAALHGRVAGRDFRLALVLRAPGTLRIEVTDARAEVLPGAVRGALPESEDGSESGRGLMLVEALADRWASFRGRLQARPFGPNSPCA